MKFNSWAWEQVISAKIGCLALMWNCKSSPDQYVCLVQVWLELEFLELCSLWEKLGERHSLAEPPENSESLSQMPCRSSLREHCHTPCAAWGRAVVKGSALYSVLAKVWPWASDIAFPSIGVRLCKTTRKTRYYISSLLMNFELVKHLAQFLTRSKYTLNVSHSTVIIIVIVTIML